MMNHQEKREIWLKKFEDNKELMDGRVKSDIEKHRKGWCRIRFTDKDGKPLANQKIEIRQKTHDFKFGANIFLLDEFESVEKNKKYRELFKEYFNLATVPFYWDALEPKEGKIRFDKDSEKIYRRPAPELCVEYCEESGIEAKLHCLVYEAFLPDWLPKYDLKAMEELYEKRIREISERYLGRLFEFEVINETLGMQTRQDCVITKRRDVVEWAFKLARKYLPKEKLVMNEGNRAPLLAELGYRDPYFMQLEKCLLNGADIDKIGLQHHIFTGVRAKTEEDYEKAVKDCTPLVDPEKILTALDMLAEFGLPLEITEITIPTFGNTSEDEELQADLLKMLYSVWFSHPAVENLVYWNSVENYCYVAGDDPKTADWNENRCRGALFHNDLTPKKSALMLKELFGKVWHTDMELLTDKDGYIEFRGFYGDYTAACNGTKFEFGLHKNQNNVYNDFSFSK